MSKRKKFFGIAGCPNGCGATFRLNFKNKPKGMAEHLTTCGSISALPDKFKNQLKNFRKRIEV